MNTYDPRQGIVEAARALGMEPLDLATIISYESGFKPDIWGGDRGRHYGLIQFGPSERQQYGVVEGDPSSQLGAKGAIVKYMTDRGFKPGMSILDAYSTINAGRPGLYNASDAAHGGQPGSVRDKVEQQFGPHRKRAEEYLANYLSQGGDYKSAREDTPSYAHPTSDTLPASPLSSTGGGHPPNPTVGTGGYTAPGANTTQVPPVVAGEPAWKKIAEKFAAGVGDVSFAGSGQNPGYPLPNQVPAAIAPVAPVANINTQQQEQQRQMLAMAMARLNSGKLWS